MEKMNCKRCEGTGTIAAIVCTGVEIPACPCIYCKGSGYFTKPDAEAILKAVAGRKQGSLRSKRPAGDREYYVWRMARFNGGADVTLPMMAAIGSDADPYRETLDQLADAVAKVAFGTNLAGAHRWGRALGYIDRGLPAGAYAGGPVADGKDDDTNAMLAMDGAEANREMK